MLFNSWVFLLAFLPLLLLGYYLLPLRYALAWLVLGSRIYRGLGRDPRLVAGSGARLA